MGDPYEELDPQIIAELREKVRKLPPLTPDQLDAVCDTLASIRRGEQG